MPSTPAPLPSLGLLDGLGTAPAGPVDSPAYLPSLGLLGGLGTAAGVSADPVRVWHDPWPSAWYADIGFAAIYAWMPVGIPVAQRDQALEYAGTVDGLAFASALSTAAGTYTAPGVPAYIGTVDSLTFASALSTAAGTYTEPGPPYSGTVAGLVFASQLSTATGTYTEPAAVTQAYGNFGWDPRIRPSWKRKELREELEAALDDAPKAVQELVRVPGPDISEAPVREALEVVRTARKHRERAVTRQEIDELHEALETVATFTREREAARQARRRKQQAFLLLS